MHLPAGLLKSKHKRSKHKICKITRCKDNAKSFGFLTDCTGKYTSQGVDFYHFTAMESNLLKRMFTGAYATMTRFLLAFSRSCKQPPAA